MIQLPLNAAPLDPAKGSLNNSRGRKVCCEHVGPTWDNERSGASATWGEGGVGMKTGRIKRWIVSRRRPIPEPRYAIVVCRGGSVEAELLMGDISATRAQLGCLWELSSAAWMMLTATFATTACRRVATLLMTALSVLSAIRRQVNSSTRAETRRPAGEATEATRACLITV